VGDVLVGSVDFADAVCDEFEGLRLVWGFFFMSVSFWCSFEWEGKADGFLGRTDFTGDTGGAVRRPSFMGEDTGVM